MRIPLQLSQSKQQEVKWEVHTTELVITESEPERSSPELSNLVLSGTPGCQGRRKWISLVSHTSRYSIWWYGGTQTTRHCYKTTLQEILVWQFQKNLWFRFGRTSWKSCCEPGAGLCTSQYAAYFQQEPSKGAWGWLASPLSLKHYQQYPKPFLINLPSK